MMTRLHDLVQRGAMFRLLPRLGVIAWMSLPFCVFSQGDQRNLIPEMRLGQDDINAGLIDFQTIFSAGKHIFSNRFTTEDFHGEAPDGPRRSLQMIAGRPNLPFLRFNGLDSQSCLECHIFLGFDPSGRFDPAMRFLKQPGMTGASGGAVNNAFGFGDFPNSTVGFVRNPPHVFGLGYVQRLAEEMSEDLMALRDQAAADAASSGSDATATLSAKGVGFGSISVAPDGTVDPAGLEGVSEDLVVRPFQFKGLASTIRNFTSAALNFHFSIQPKELLDRGIIPDDKDGLLNEILEGEVSAVSTFVAFNRPPAQILTGLDPGAVERGRAVLDQALCTDCHVASLKIEDPRVTVIDPRTMLPIIALRLARGIKDPPTPERPTLMNGEKSSEDLAVVQQYRRNGAGRRTATTLVIGATNPPDRLPGFTRNLNLEGGPLETLPRLPFDPVTGSVDVPLFTDLKRHKMGDLLAESFTQGTDVAGIVVAGDEFVTRPLWGVADTAPWLHDGRALTLFEAILMHEGTGSEANDSVAAFQALSAEDQAALRTFLLSLRLPILQTSTISGAATPWKRY